MNRDELVELVEKIRSGSGTEAQEDVWVAELKAAVTDPHVVDNIFWDTSPRPLTAEQIVDRALTHRPVEL